ncbi:MAG: S9 family peptidase [Wenzhouxiangellaceae bacterium]
MTTTHFQPSAIVSRAEQRLPALLLCWLLALPAMAIASDTPADQPLTIERIFASPDLAGPSIRALKPSPAGDRVTFLQGKSDDKDQLDLWEYHIPSGETRLLVDSRELVPDAGELSDEEKARRERQRLAGLRGIVNYTWSRDGRFVLFPLAGDIYLYAVDGAAGDNRVQRVTTTEGFETDPQVSPDGRYIAYIRDQNLYINDWRNGKERALTHDGGGALKNGMAEFIAQEEMARHTGYWWSPDSQRIAFLQVDESPVPVTRRYEIEADDIRIIEQRYPYAGADNVTIRLGVINVDDGDIRWVDHGDEQDVYLPRVKWLPDGRLSYQRQSRNQQRLELLLANPAEDGNPIPSNVLVTETADTWVDLHDDLRFLKQGAEFVWSSARDGYKHLYLYNDQGRMVRRLTQGSWQVDEVESIDEENGWVYFTASAESPLQQHLYRQRFDAEYPARVKQLTSGDGYHDIEMDRHGQIFISHYSNRQQPPQIALHQASGERITWLLQNQLDEQHPYAPYMANHQPTQYGMIRATDGQSLHYRLTKPQGFDPEKKYPVFYYVYGGPTSQTVTRRWDRRILFEQYMARQGFIVFSLDNRGTPRRGMAFQAPAYLALGTVEVEDHRRGVTYLRSLNYVDSQRIGIFGWSYGGYLTLMALLKDPDSYAMGVAVAPVTDWRLYDTHYTERYLGQPQQQTEAYSRANVLEYAHQLQRPLLLIHGMADDNVLFSHTTQLYRELQNNGILFDTMPYPGGKHGISGQAAQTHVYSTIANYFKKHLLPEKP